jgi:acetyl-CoA carboxylase biotin carboxyl carrier protein
MNLKELKELIALMDENKLTELEIEREGMRVKLKRLPEGGFAQTIEAVPAAFVQKGPAIAEPQAARPEPSTGRKLIEIKAPMVGTFYAAPSPESAPYVEIGASVEVGQVLCIIEAMKLMNEIKSEVRGKIVERLVENAQPIEYGQVLFLVEPA